MIQQETFYGYWRLPNSKDEVAGTLVFDPYSTTMLTLMGFLGGIEEFLNSAKEVVIYGYTLDGKEITLIDCFPNGRKLTFPGIPHGSYAVSRVIVGMHLEDTDAIVFKGAVVEIELLSDWLCSWSKTDRICTEDGFGIEYRNLPPIEFNLTPEYNAAFDFEGNCEFKDDVFTISNRTLFEIRSIAPEKMLKLIHCVGTFKKFLSLAYYQDISIKSLYLVIQNENIPEQNEEKRVRILYQQRSFGKRAKRSPSNVVFRYKEIQDDFHSIIQKWYVNEREISPILKNLNELLTVEEFSAANFMDVINGLEAFHRRVRQNTEELTAEHSKWLKTIFGRLEESDVDLLRKRLEHAYEPSLSQRLKDLIREFDDVLLVKFFGKPKEVKRFISKTVITRNYFTHYDKSQENAIWKMQDLYYVTEKLKIVLFYAVLRETLFTKELIKTIILGWRKFDWLRRQ